MDLYVSRLQADTALPGKLQGQNEKYVSYICRKHFLSPCFDQAVGLLCSLATTAFSPCLHRAIRGPVPGPVALPQPRAATPILQIALLRADQESRRNLCGGTPCSWQPSHWLFSSLLFPENPHPGKWEHTRSSRTTCKTPGQLIKRGEITFSHQPRERERKEVKPFLLN